MPSLRIRDWLLRPLTRQPIVLFRRRQLHSSPWNRSVAEAASVARPATFEKEEGTSCISDVTARRARAGKLVAGVAAYSDSDMFKGPSDGRPKAKRWDSHLSRESKNRKLCSLKQMAKHLKTPGLISLGGGLPSPEYFPIAELSMRVPISPPFSEKELFASGDTIRIGKYDVADGKSEYDLSIALNYCQANGSAQMIRFVTEQTEIVCRPPYADWRCSQTMGSTGAMEQALRIFCDKERADSVLTEEYTFSTPLETMAALGIKSVGVKMDVEGMIPESVDELLSTWDSASRNARKPHLLYTVPSGQNPTGATQGAQRRKAIYEVCQKHNLYVIEDEPYYFLQMAPYTRSKASPSPPASIDEFLSTLMPSLLSMDVDGRVMRMDSFSKVLVPGSRLGWVTASEQIIDRYIRHGESAQGPSGFSQVVLHRLLDETWGHEGYFRWLMNLRGEYTARRNIILAACEEFLPRNIVSWNPPGAGMFLWLKVDHRAHPDALNRSILDIEEEIFQSCIRKGVLVAKGSFFRAEQDKPPEDLFFRTTYAMASAENIHEAVRRLGSALKESFKM